MDCEKFPKETNLVKSDFENEHCCKIIDGVTDASYFSYYKKLEATAVTFLAKEDYIQGKIYWLLADACSMMLSSKLGDEPLMPFAVFNERRSTIIDDFSEEDISFFSEILPEITDSLLRARIADIVWIKACPKNNNYARIAIDSYCKIPINKETWYCEGRACCYRAVKLASIFKRQDPSVIHKIESYIKKGFDKSTIVDDFFALQLADLMFEFKLNNENALNIAKKLEFFALQFRSNDNFVLQIDYYEGAAKWYLLARDSNKASDMLSSQAECHLNTDSENSFGAINNFQKAIEILRTIPKTERERLSINERIEDLQKLINKSSKTAFDEMQVFTSKEIDITELVKLAESSVENKSKIEAIKSFANLSPVMNFSKMKENSIKRVKTYLFQSLNVGTHFSKDGRFIAKTKGISLDSTIDCDDPKVKESIMESHGINLTLVVQAYILPTLRILHLEHRITEFDFLEIAKHSPIIPPGRETIFARGFYFGYEYDYATALHILIPQIENMVRYHLKKAGAITSTFDNDLFENENSLSTLIKLPQMITVFGENLTFEIKALFCDPLGANLRNEIAHGIIDYNGCNSISGVYAWWFILKLIFNSYWTFVNREPIVN